MWTMRAPVASGALSTLAWKAARSAARCSAGVAIRPWTCTTTPWGGRGPRCTPMAYLARASESGRCLHLIRLTTLPGGKVRGRAATTWHTDMGRTAHGGGDLEEGRCELGARTGVREQ